MYILFKLF